MGFDAIPELGFETVFQEPSAFSSASFCTGSRSLQIKKGEKCILTKTHHRPKLLAFSNVFKYFIFKKDNRHKATKTGVSFNGAQNLTELPFLGLWKQFSSLQAGQLSLDFGTYLVNRSELHH